MSIAILYDWLSGIETINQNRLILGNDCTLRYYEWPIVEKHGNEYILTADGTILNIFDEQEWTLFRYKVVAVIDAYSVREGFCDEMPSGSI